jgi:digeranylgeranylglycerophospholipid reductase
LANPEKDVIIVGAGPSGSRLAFRLCQLGYAVLVLDRKAAAGENICCTGIVSQQCVDDFGIDSGIILRHASSAKFVGPSGNDLRFSHDSRVACILDRPALDRALAGRAREAGAEYAFATEVTAVEPETDSVRVRASCPGEEVIFNARAVVLANGFGSPLPRRLGMGAIKDVVIGAQARVAVSGVDEVEVYFDRSLAPGGFAWLVPHNESAGLAGLLTRYRPEQHLESLLSRLQTQGKIVSTELERDYAAVPRGSLPLTGADRILVLGEAAGQVKPTTGGGIYYGLLCADIAADCLEAAFNASDLSAARLSWYDRQWRARLGREIKIGSRLCRFYQRLGNGNIERLFKLARGTDLPRFISDLEALPLDWHGALAVKLLKYLAVNVPLRAAVGLVTRGRR